MRTLRSQRKMIKRAIQGHKPRALQGGTSARTRQAFRTAKGQKWPRRNPKAAKYRRVQEQRYNPIQQRVSPTYTAAKGYDLLYEMGGFKPGAHYRVADLACGLGLVGLEVKKRILEHGGNVQATFVDLAQKNLDKIPKDNEVKVGDLRKTHARDGAFTHTFCRYAVKNMPEKEQMQALREIARVTEKGGVFVLQDMVSPEGLREFQNAERMAKQRTTTKTPTPMNVPTEREWMGMLNKTGFVVEDVQHTVSNIDTTNWVAEGQMTQQALDTYFTFLKKAKQRWPRAWQEYKIIDQGNGNFKITYPVVLFKCRKV